MRIILTNHARMRAQERWITIQEIFSIIESPDIIEEQSENIICFKKKWNKYLTLVYAKDSEWNWVIITVLKTSKIRKYI